MAVRLVSATDRQAHGTCLEIGLVNNMPDSALEQTEEQFASLLGEASEGIDVRLQFFALPGVPRAGEARRRTRSYGSLGDLLESTLDGVIVTGAEPRAAELTEEPYWNDLVRVIDWAASHTSSAVWSCLAAHAAVLYLDGIRRDRRTEKRFGVFECERVTEGALGAGIGRRLPMPHSRWNDLPEDELRASGYQVLTRSEAAGVDAFFRRGQSLFVFFQGHPEYGPDVLLREYCRDIKRFLRGERDDYPDLPENYFEEAATCEWAAFRERALASRTEELASRFPAVRARSLAAAWRPGAVCLYRNWLNHLCANRKESAGERSRIAAAVRE